MFCSQKVYAIINCPVIEDDKHYSQARIAWECAQNTRPLAEGEQQNKRIVRRLQRRASFD